MAPFTITGNNLAWTLWVVFDIYFYLPLLSLKKSLEKNRSRHSFIFIRSKTPRHLFPFPSFKFTVILLSGTRLTDWLIVPGIEPGPLHWAASSAHFSFWDRVSLTCLGTTRTYHLPSQPLSVLDLGMRCNAWLGLLYLAIESFKQNYILGQQLCIYSLCYRDASHLICSHKVVNKGLIQEKLTGDQVSLLPHSHKPGWQHSSFGV